VRDTLGFKLILSSDGGGKGEWSPEQLPNKSSVSVSVEGSQTFYPLGTSNEAWCADGVLGCNGTVCVQKETCFPGGDMQELENITGPTQCCEVCAKLSACAGFTFRPPHCLLKSKISHPADSGCTSGYKRGHAPALPTPAPAPSPPAVEMVLYNVVSDPGERTTLSTTDPANAAIVAKLQKVVDDYAKTKVPQAQADPKCPKFSGLNTTDPTGAAQKYIGPWCDGF
jgi:hypothetical protein